MSNDPDHLSTQPEQRARFGLLPGLSARMAGFVGVGLLNTLLSFLIFQVLLFWTAYQVAYGLSFLAGMLFSLLGNAQVFRSRLTPMKAFLYSAQYLLLYVVGLSVLHFLVLQGVPERVAPLFVLVVLVPLSFLATRISLTSPQRDLRNVIRRCTRPFDHDSRSPGG